MHLEDKGLISLKECFIDGTFIVAKRSPKVGIRGKGMKLMVIANAFGLPVAVHTDSPNPHDKGIELIAPHRKDRRKAPT